MCSSKKVAYPTRKIARTNRRELERQHEKKFTIYKCTECSMFHLATKTNGKQKKKGSNLQRTVFSIDRFLDIPLRIDRLDEQRRRQMSGASKAAKSNRRGYFSKLDKFYD